MNDTTTAIPVLQPPSPAARAISARELASGAARLVRRPWTLAREHGLNPWVFVVMAAFGHLVQILVFLPWFRGAPWQLGFFIVLRVSALPVPLYVWARGRRVSAAFGVSVAAMFVFNTAWHVCYFVYA